ncbi:unnamed protein product, partial [Didymodactylos carnosus]
MHSPRESDD